MSAPNLNRQRSRELMDRARRVVAGGISSQIRLNEPGGEPLFFDRSEGALMWDADGNQYIDYIQGMGPNIFGHAPEFVSNQVSEDMRKGYVFAAQFERELEVAEMAADAVPYRRLHRTLCQFGHRDRPTSAEASTGIHRENKVHKIRRSLPRLDGQRQPLRPPAYRRSWQC